MYNRDSASKTPAEDLHRDCYDVILKLTGLHETQEAPDDEREQRNEDPEEQNGWVLTLLQPASTEEFHWTIP